MRENPTLEFKSEISKTFLKTVSAFANFGSGTILFGVDDNGIALGLEDPAQACIDIENRINDSFDPRPCFSLTVDEERRTVALFIEEGYDKPYLLNGKAYRRSDSATVEVDKLELRRLVLEGKDLCFDEVPYKGADLTFSYLEARLIDSIAISSLSDDLMRTLGLLTNNGYNNAAAILADSNHFPGIDIARFDDSEDIILDRESTSGVSMIESFDKAMSFLERYCRYEKIAVPIRESIETVPLKACREAVANAFAHRTWDVSAPVRVSLFSDRVEVVSPGGLPAGMSVSAYKDGRYSVLRNPLLAETLSRLGIIEKFGTGVRRIKRAYEGTQKQPLFDVGEDFISVTLPVLTEGASLSEDEATILALIPDYTLVTRSALDERTGFEKTKSIRILNSLIAKGLVRASGKGPARRYSRK